MRSSVENGSNSATRIPMTLVLLLRRLLATIDDSYPRSSMTAWTWREVWGATP